MPNRLSLAFQHFIRVRKLRSAIEAEVYVSAISHDVAEAVFQRFAGEGKTNRERVSLDDGFDRIGRFFQDHFAKREGQVRNMWIVGGKIAEQLRVRWPDHLCANSIERR